MPPLPASITIRTGARLHFGPLSYQPETGRHFGGIGMMLERPGVELTATSPATGRRFGILSPRAESTLQSLKSRNPDLQASVQIDLAAEIPAHSGLGSGTQLSLAMMEALLLMEGRTASPIELAEKCGRGDRSAIGLHGYRLGGFLVDGGHAAGAAFGELACRVDFPDAWRVLLLHPLDAKGLHGSVEMQAFQKLGSMSESVSGRLCRLTLTEILPALTNHNFAGFAAALLEYGQLVGEFFAATQGGVFASPMMRTLLKRLPEIERTGMAQSSWGPTIAMFAESETEAAELRRRIWSIIPGADCPIEITRARNAGRQLTTSPST
ncbi:beta-ribofuranosylaminobenzene 5'-phosphate synthase family protein [Planctomicrobium sp. SH661]|uniref:GHMP family kinase ATP-binding protein n=1 Tax=Planctomicrobium sp. SH661 TaxID=3448124 RepID=UPI003F5B1BD0